MRVKIKKDGIIVKSTVITYDSNLSIGEKLGYEGQELYYTVFCDGEDIQYETGMWESPKRAGEILEWILSSYDKGIDCTINIQD